MTDTEKLELRRKVTQVFHPDRDVRIEVGDVWIYNRVPTLGWTAKRTAPALESNNGLALDALDKLCEQWKWYWVLKRVTFNGKLAYFSCRIGNVEGMPDGMIAVKGETPAIAACLAMIEARLGPEEK